MGGMWAPGTLHAIYGTYVASLLMSLTATTLALLCFATMHVHHPLVGVA